MVEVMDAAALAVGDAVELIDVPPGRSALKVGMRGRVICAGLAWDAVSVEWQVRRPWPSLLAPRHLRRVAP